MSELAFHVKRWPRAAFSAPIRLYSSLVSPALPRRCKYEPTCSAYAVEAIGKFGVIRGSILGIWRLLRCNPFSHGGFDPVREEFSLRDGPISPAVFHGETCSCDQEHASERALR